MKKRPKRQEQYEFFWLGTDFYTEERTKNLRARLGTAAVFNVLGLFGWTVQNRPSGLLNNMNEHEIEEAAQWGGGSGVFVPALVASGFLEKGVDGYRILQWDRHFDPFAVKRPPKAQREWRKHQREPAR